MTRVRQPFRLALLCAVLFAGTVALYGPVLRFGFVDYDDPDFVTMNRHVLGGFSAENVRWAFTSGGNAANWQPLTWLSLMSDAEAWGDDAAGYHLTNVLWHGANAALAFLLVRALIGVTSLSFWAAALFAWHPLRVESVAWVAERKDVMSVFFGLFTLCAYVGHLKRRGTNPAAGRCWYGAALLAYAFGLLCKPMVVTLPVVLLCVRWATARERTGESMRLSAVRGALPGLAPFAGLSLASAVITYQVHRHAGAPTEVFSVADRLVTAVAAIGAYVRTFAWPARLAIAYPPGEATPATLLVAILIVAGVTALALRLRRRQSWILAGWVWFVVMLLPVLGLVSSGAQARADRYTYLPGLGLELVVLGLVRAIRWTPRWRAIGIAAAAGALVVAARQTRALLPSWADSKSLFEHALARSPDNYLALSCRATTLRHDGDLKAAGEQASRALRLHPGYVPALLISGVLAEAAGRTDDALQCYHAALRRAPRYAPVHERIGTVLLHEGAWVSALAEFDAATQARDEAPVSELGRALALWHLQREAEAGRAFARALTLRPDYAEANAAYARFLDEHQDRAGAWAHFRAALRGRPRYQSAQYEFAVSLARAGRPAAALDHFRAALTLAPDDTDARSGYAAVEEELHAAETARASAGDLTPEGVAAAGALR